VGASQTSKKDFSQFLSLLSAGDQDMDIVLDNVVGHLDQVSMLLNFFLSSLMTRPNKLEGLSLETLSSQVLKFEDKAGANTIGAPFKCFLLG
jgi:hypothetical protein